MSEESLNCGEQTDWRRLLSAAERAAMLREIASVSLAAGTALLPEQPWSDLDVAAGPGDASKSPTEQLAHIEHLLPVLTRASEQISHSPLAVGAADTRAVRPAQARRVTTAAWMVHARQAGRSVQETRTTLSHDTPENRAVKSFLTVLERDCRVIAQVADREEESEVSARAMLCARRLRLLQAESWWEEVTAQRGDWTRPPTQREALSPAYGRVSQERSRYRKCFRFDWDNPLLTLPPRLTWRLYELWCFFTVLHALRGIGCEVTLAQELLAVREGRLTLTLATGERSRIALRDRSGRSLALTYNQAFTEGSESLSHTMQPDITLSDGERVWILDAKFKPYALPGEEGEDINQMHAYRDAIVGRRQNRTVASAWCLYAGPAQTPRRQWITYGRGQDAPVGALCLRPGDAETLTRLAGLLKHWLAADRLENFLETGPGTPAPPPFPET